MSYQVWFEHFREQLNGLTEAFEKSGSSLSLLGFAMKEKYIHPEVYLKWASNHHLLPVLQSHFFSETTLSPAMFANWAAHFPWSEEFLPVAEWDGSLIIACLQPPQNFPENPKAIFVLTNFENLQRAWETYHFQEKTPQIPHATITKKHASDGFSFDDLQIGETGPKTSLELSDDLLQDSTSGESSKENSLAENLEIPAEQEGLEGLFDGPTVIQLTPLTPADLTVIAPLNNEIQTPQPVQKAFSTESETVVLKATLPPPPPTPVQKTPPPIKIADAYDDSDNEGEKTVGNLSTLSTTAPPRPTGMAKPTINNVITGNFSLEKMKKKNSTLVADKVKTTLSQMKAYFDKSMILALDNDETQAIPFAWDEKFQDIKDVSNVVPLKIPSVFNIVSSTQKPFHGFISANTVNEDFFAIWNNGAVPDHVTITPIIINDKIAGLLMGFGTKATYNRSSLGLAEKLSAEFIKGLPAA